MKWIKYGRKLMTINGIFWIVYTTLFFFVENPIVEKYCELVFETLAVIVIGLFLYPLLDVYQNWIASQERKVFANKIIGDSITRHGGFNNFMNYVTNISDKKDNEETLA